jgi:hypothetical protein
VELCRPRLKKARGSDFKLFLLESEQFTRLDLPRSGLAKKALVGIYDAGLLRSLKIDADLNVLSSEL